MKTIPVTAELLHILKRCSQYATQNVNALKDAPEYNLQNSVGDILQTAVEIALQDVAVLDDLVKRYSDK